MNTNITVLIGRLTKDIELKATPSGKKVATFNLAVNRGTQDGKEITDFIQCVAWEQTAVFLNQYCKKGTRIGVQGRLQTRTYESQKGKQFITEVVANRVELLDNKPVQQPVQQQQYQAPYNEPEYDPYAGLEITSDDLPF